MSEYLSVLESAISDVGHWTWWTAILPDTFQVEFDGTQLWSPPLREGQPPSGQIALLFRKPRLVYFVTLSDAVPEDWPDRLQKDELGSFGVNHEEFTLTSPESCRRLLVRAMCVRALVGEPGRTPRPKAGEAFLGFAAGPIGMVVAASSMAVLSQHGELGSEAVLDASRRWGTYWREYWRRLDTPDPMPRDHTCEVTIPAAPDASDSSESGAGRE